MSNNALHRQRARLFFRQKGKCHYCGCDMVLMWRIPPYFRPPNLCTVEHLNDRNGGPRPDLQGEFLRVASLSQERDGMMRGPLGVALQLIQMDGAHG